jgi:starch synthase
MQVFFIYILDFFQRKFIFRNKEGKFFEDNDERTVFFSKGVLETVKKLGWAPDLIHCNGWFSSLLPLFVRTAYKHNPIFSDSKIVVSIYNDGFTEQFKPDFENKVLMNGIEESDFGHYKGGNYVSLMKGAIDYADAVIQGSPEINEEVLAYAKASGKPMLDYQESEDYYVAYNVFYDKIISEA